MDKNEKLRFLLEELREQELIYKNFNELVSGDLTIKKEILDQIINSDKYKKIRAEARRPGSDGEWAREYKNQIVAEEKARGKKEIDNTKMEIAEVKIKIIKDMIEELVGKDIKDIWGKLDELELEEVLDEYIWEKISFDVPNELP